MQGAQMFLEPPKGTGKNMNSKWVFFLGVCKLDTNYYVESSIL